MPLHTEHCKQYHQNLNKETQMYVHFQFKMFKMFYPVGGHRRAMNGRKKEHGGLRPPLTSPSLGQSSCETRVWRLKRQNCPNSLPF